MVVGAHRVRTAGPANREADLTDSQAERTTLRRDVLTLPGVAVGAPDPLPPLRPLDELHELDARSKQGMPRDMARQIGYEKLRSVLPEQLKNGYGRERAPSPSTRW